MKKNIKKILLSSIIAVITLIIMLPISQAYSGRKMKVGEEYKYTGAGLNIYSDKNAALIGYIFKKNGNLKKDNNFTVEGIYGNIIKIGKNEYINVISVFEKNLKKINNSFKINSPERILVKDTVQLTTNLKSDSGNTKIKWSSSNTKVAKVDGNGKVTGVTFGKVTITATMDNGKTATQELIIVDNTYIDIENLTLETLTRDITTQSKAVMQNFAFEFNKKNEISNIYISQEGKKNDKKRPIYKITDVLCTKNCKHTGACSKKITTPQIVNISKLTYDSSEGISKNVYYDENIENRMRIRECNHGDSLEIYDNEILTLYTYTTGVANRRILKIAYDEENIKIKESKTIKYKYWNEVAEVTGLTQKGSIKLKNKNKNGGGERYSTAAIDEKNGLVVLRRGTKKDQWYDIINYASLFNSKQTDIKNYIISSINVSNKDNNTFQGMDIYGNYIYIYETSATMTRFGYNKHGDSLISIYDLDGNCIVNRYNVEENLAKKGGEIRNDVYADILESMGEKNGRKETKYIGSGQYTSYEAEGIKVYNGRLYIGLSTNKKNKEKAYHHIFYFK